MAYIVSVIVPIYNTEKYLDECLESIVNQSYRELEILLIDDGSSDSSPMIADKWADKDKRIRVFHQENSGVSAARNVGLEKAIGKYLLFVDSDDTFHPRYVEWLLSEMVKTEASFGAFGIEWIEGDNYSERCIENNRKQWDISFSYLKEDESAKAYNHTEKWDVQTMGGKIIEKSKLDGLVFRTDIRYGEDTLFLQKYLGKGVKAVYGQSKLFYYRVHGNNAISRKYSLNRMQYINGYMAVAQDFYISGEYDCILMWVEKAFTEICVHYENACNEGNSEWKNKTRALAKEFASSPFINAVEPKRRFNYILFAFSPIVWKVYRKIAKAKKSFKEIN